MPPLSKSKYLIGLQCPKHLWLEFNDPDKIPEFDAATQHRFDQGHLVGQLAKKYFPKGIDISEKDISENIKKTKELLKKKKILFEAGISTENLYSRADILKPVKDEWDIIEVKMGTSVKDVNIQDVSFQKHCYEKYGLKIRKCCLMHVNNKYVRKGKINPKKFFKIKDITSDVNEAIKGIQERIDLMFKIIGSDKYPDMSIGKRCSDPYDCPISECWDFLPENHIFKLYRGGNRSMELFEDGIHAIKDIPDKFKLTGHQEIQKHCSKTGKPYVNKDGIKQFLKRLQEPLYFLDFETFSSALPFFDGTKPYQQIPFQFSLHVVNRKVKHHSFLAEGKKDPRKEFISKLKEVLGEKGSIIVYNQSFEKGILKKLALEFPKHKKWVEGVLGRIVDLLFPFRNFHYYHPKQQGSASLKAVLPAVTGKGYDDLEIAQGGDASLAYLDYIYGDLKEKERKKIKKDLEKYCGLDTEGMIWILDGLREV